MELGERSSRVLEVIVEHIDEKGYAPTYREICKRAGLASTSSVYTHLAALRRHGLIDFEPGLQRTIRVTGQGSKA